MHPASKSKCPFHDRAFELICTQRNCPKPRLGCTRCFYDKTHKECKPFTVLIEDLNNEEFNDGLESWILTPEQRKKLNEINGIYPYDLDDYGGEILDMVTIKFEKLKSEILKRLEKLEIEVKNVVKSKVLGNETMKTFRDHYSLKRLKELIDEVLEKSDQTQKLSKYFDFSVESFLEKYRQEKELIYFDKQQYELFLKNKEGFQENLLKELDFGLFSLDYMKILFVPQTNLQSVKRFNKIGNSWGYVKDKLDCITFKPSSNVLFQGIGVLKPLKQGEKLSINFKFLDGDSNESPVLIEKNSIITQKNGETIETLIIDNAILLKKDKIYSICCRIEGEDSFNGCEGVEMAGDGNIFFNFMDTVIVGNNKDNNTNVSHGQIPEIYYSVVAEK